MEHNYTAIFDYLGWMIPAAVVLIAFQFWLPRLLGVQGEAKVAAKHQELRVRMRNGDSDKPTSGQRSPQPPDAEAIKQRLIAH